MIPGRSVWLYSWEKGERRAGGGGREGEEGGIPGGAKHKRARTHT